MNISEQINLSASKLLMKRIPTLIIGRLFVIFVLLFASWLWNSERLTLSIDNFPRGLFIVFLISVGLTIAYFVIFRFNKNYDWQVRVQFILDAALVTWLVWRTGDLASPYLTLYIVLISVGGVYLRSMETLLYAVFCVFLFTLLTTLSAVGAITSFGTTSEISKLIQIVGFHDIAFLVVGLLAARISQRHESSEKLRETAKSLADLRVLHERIVESIRSGLITTDLEGNIYTFNLAAEEITGIRSQDMIGKSIYSIFSNIKHSVVTSLKNSASEEFHQRFETDFITPDDFILRIGYSISPLFSEIGEHTGLIMTFQDLTDIRTMEESIRRKDRLAAVGRVAAGLAHEIRNPLGAMRGAIQVLESKTPPDTAQANLMEIILRESDRLNKIITNFLTYARPRVSNFSAIDVRESVADTFTLLEHSPDVKENHHLETDLPEEAVLISADPTQLKQIFWNLARNAVLAMPDGGSLKVSISEISRDRIRILFEDTGIGMPPEQVEQLFEPFSNSTTGGTGLGLSIVYQIVRDHNGTINVRSTENKGTTITIELPRSTKNLRQTIAADESRSEQNATKLEDFLSVEADESEKTP
ncbi:MAG: PAS domain-containing protein [Pyrinomonadaceae bacterium]|nr:PAS domain-containing protein [Pyrinomonadaceae bacterium]